jgi:alginate O-acetyltransferase complex protein AlgI
MLFHSPEFMLVFLPGTVALFYLLGRIGGLRAALTFLVVASLVFYGWWDPRFIALLVGSAAVNFTLARWMSAHRQIGSATKPLLVLGVALNLGALGFFKYADFFIANVAAATGIDMAMLGIALPLAISFFTFQQIAFLADVHTGVADDPDPLSYLLFVTFFPQLIAGPIVHHREMMPQFAARARERDAWDDLAAGLTIFCIGLFKKTVIADHMAFASDSVFAAAAAGSEVTFLEAWTGALSFSFQIYFDFSGYTDMAIGLARMFGIHLPLNFASPYKATSIIDFWRRWHMTLSRFLRDYLYIPLGGGRRGEPRRHANILIVMVLGGLWHGAAWTFVLWGALHGVYLIVNHLWRTLRGGREAGALATWIARAVTFLAVTVTWIPFRAGSMDATVAMLRGITGLDGVVLPLHYEGVLGPAAANLQALGVTFGFTPLFGGGQQIAILLAVLAGVWLLPNTDQIMRTLARSTGPVLDRIAAGAPRTGAAFARSGVAVAMGMLIGAGAFAMALRQLQGQAGEFIYFQF